MSSLEAALVPDTWSEPNSMSLFYCTFQTIIITFSFYKILLPDYTCQFSWEIREWNDLNLVTRIGGEVSYRQEKSLTHGSYGNKVHQFLWKFSNYNKSSGNWTCTNIALFPGPHGLRTRLVQIVCTSVQTTMKHKCLSTQQKFHTETLYTYQFLLENVSPFVALHSPTQCNGHIWLHQH